MNETMELAPAQEISSGNLMAVLDRAARDEKCDVEKMERLLALVERVKSRESEEAFNKSMAACQAEMPAVFRDASNPSTQSRYTRLESLHSVVVPVTTKHGFSMSFGTADCTREGHYRVTCHVSHNSGHSRDYQLDLPNDSLGPKGLPNKTLVHGAGSSMSYGRRYLTLMIFNVALTNEDDDANIAGRKPQNAPGRATERTREWFVEQMKDMNEQALNFYAEHGFLTPDETLSQLALEHVPVTKPALAKLREEIKEWAKQ